MVLIFFPISYSPETMVLGGDSSSLATVHLTVTDSLCPMATCLPFVQQASLAHTEALMCDLRWSLGSCWSVGWFFDL